MDAHDHAEAYRDVLAEMKRARKEYMKLRAVAEYHKSKAGEAVNSVSHVVTKGIDEVRVLASGRFSGVKQIDAAEAVLRERGRPMKTAEIAEAMLLGGYEADPKKLRNALFTGLGRKPKTFIKLDAGTWGLHEQNGHAESPN